MKTFTNAATRLTRKAGAFLFVVIGVAASRGALAGPAPAVTASLPQATQRPAPAATIVFYRNGLFTCLFPWNWKLSRSKAKAARAHYHETLAMRPDGRATLKATVYFRGHPSLSTPEAYLRSSGIAKVDRMRIGKRWSAEAYRFERAQDGRREFVTVQPVKNLPYYFVLQYSAPAGSFDDSVPAYDQLLRSLRFSWTPTPRAETTATEQSAPAKP